jgi:hypothetical protein
MTFEVWKRSWVLTAKNLISRSRKTAPKKE